jgi:hypothetical protein
MEGRVCPNVSSFAVAVAIRLPGITPISGSLAVQTAELAGAFNLERPKSSVPSIAGSRRRHGSSGYVSPSDAVQRAFLQSDAPRDSSPRSNARTVRYTRTTAWRVYADAWGMTDRGFDMHQGQRSSDEHCADVYQLVRSGRVSPSKDQLDPRALSHGSRVTSERGYICPSHLTLDRRW